MLLCDECDQGYHIYCLDPPLKSIPKTDWFCSDCIDLEHEFGFEEGGEYSLTNFLTKSTEFRNNWFSNHIRNKTLNEDVIEKEYWNIVETSYKNVQVEYGADLHSTEHGR